MKNIITILVLVCLNLIACNKQKQATDSSQKNTESTDKKLNQSNLDSSEDQPKKETKSENIWQAGKYNDLGFYKTTDTGIPSEITNTANSVFKLKVIGGDNKKLIRSLDLTKDLEKFNDEISKLDLKIFDRTDRIILQKMIERCEKEKNEEFKKKCPISGNIHTGTGFITDDGDVLWTNFHVVEPFLKLRESLDKITIEQQLDQKMNLRVFIFDQNDNLVLNPYENNVTPLKLPPLSKRALSTNKMYAEDSDYIALSLNKKIGKGLAFTKNKTTPGDRLFLIGFPACTNCSTDGYAIDDLDSFMDRSPAPNSDGNGLKISSGIVLDNNTAATFYNVSIEALNNWDLEKMISFTADSNHGNSGGPILNKEGNVVGIHRGGVINKTATKTVRVSNGVVLLGE